MRNYDPQIGRWWQADPYNQFPSPYTGIGNNPINLVDPSGGFSGFIPCPGASGLSIFMQNIGQAVSSITSTTAYMIASTAVKAAGFGVNLANNAVANNLASNRPMDDYLIRRNGEIVVTKTSDNFDRFYVENNQTSEGNMVIRSYNLVAKLDKNDAGLVNFPAKGDGFSRYGGVQPKSTLSGEEIGTGDHWLQPKAAAALFGTIYDAKMKGINNIAFGDMSTSTGSDPATAATKTAKEFHHKGHGHFGRYSGLNADFRYLGKDGNSFQSSNAFLSDNYSHELNQVFYESAKKYGFTINGQGNSGNLLGVNKWGGHNNHGHIGLSPNPSNFINYIPYKK